MVSKTWYRLASAYIKAMALTCSDLKLQISPAFAELTGLTGLGVSIKAEEHVCLLFAQPVLAQMVTHVHLHLPWMQPSWPRENRGLLAQLADLPRLRSLVLARPGDEEVGSMDSVAQRLEQLKVRGRIHFSAPHLTQFSVLQSLDVSLAKGAGRDLRQLTMLRDLRSLTLTCGASAQRNFSVLTALTALDWTVASGPGFVPVLVLDGVAQLKALRSLTLSLRKGWLMKKHAEGISSLTALTLLDVRGLDFADCVASSPFLVPLTGLVSLAVACGVLYLSQLPLLDLEALRSLTMLRAHGEATMLSRATRLTSLGLQLSQHRALVGLDVSLAAMSGLQFLSLYMEGQPLGGPASSLASVVRGMPGLRGLTFSGSVVAETDVAACASLADLRSLVLVGARGVPPADLPTLQGMSGLSVLHLSHTGVSSEDITPDVEKAFNAERWRRGWADLDLVVVSRCPGESDEEDQ